jgi:YbbR domain-containing protein
LFEKEPIKNTVNKSAATPQNQTAILFICMGIAVLLWVANKLSHDYTGEITAKINYTNIPEGQILSGRSTGSLTLQVKTKGSSLLWYKLTRPTTSVDINFAKLPSHRNQALSSRLKSDIAASLPKGYELIAILPETLYYHTDKKASKLIPVELQAVITYEEQYGLSGDIILNPAFVNISGAAKDIMTIDKWKTEKLVLQKIKNSKQGEIGLEPPFLPGITIEPAKIQYSIPVDKYTGHEVVVPLKAIHVPPKMNITLYPKNIKISFQVSLKNFERVQPEMFQAVADFSSHQFDKDKYVAIKVIRAPDFVKHVHASPSKAEYIIHK